MMDGITGIRLGAAGLLLLGILASTGCEEHGCLAIGIPSQVTLTLHLPPEHDVAMPETVKVCQLPKCATGTLPPVSATFGAGFDFGPFFSDRGPQDTSVFAPSSAATGRLSLQAGGVRLLVISWPVVVDDAFNPRDPRNTYDVSVRDASGAETGKLSNQTIAYHHLVDERCHVNAWTGAATD